MLPLDVHIDVIADKTFRELLNQVIPHIKGVFQNFNEPDNCDVQNEQSGVLSVAEDLLDYLNGGFKDERELENIPQPFKEEVEIQLERNLGALARNLQTMISQYRSGNAKSAIQSYFGKLGWSLKLILNLYGAISGRLLSQNRNSFKKLKWY